MKHGVARDYARKSDPALGDFALHVGNSISGNANFTTPPTTGAALITQAAAFNTGVANAVNSTPTQTALKNNLRLALIATLDQLASYVEQTANGDEAKILSSGFNATGGARSTAVPGASGVDSANNVATGKLRLVLLVADNAWAYVVEYTNVATGVIKTAVFTDPHDAVLEGLTPGAVYALRVQVMGSKNKKSEWSETVQHMST